jgi:hypothetical protein
VQVREAIEQLIYMCLFREHGAKIHKKLENDASNKKKYINSDGFCHILDFRRYKALLWMPIGDHLSGAAHHKSVQFIPDLWLSRQIWILLQTSLRERAAT